MPKRTDISSVLVIGSGPIIIGQACEFDYSGTQACRVLKEEGIRVILVNSNPATIMTDPDFADATYIEPITRMDLMSSRFGTSGLPIVHELEETVEQVRRVVRSGRGLRVVLDGERLQPALGP